MPEEVFDQSGLAEAFNAAVSGSGTTTVDDTPIDTGATDTTTAQTDASTQVDTPEPTQTDYWSILSEKSGGLVKDEDSFTQISTKAKGYDDLETKLKDLETKVPKFTNPESETLYKLWADGNKDAVVNYIRESTKDFKTMSDLDIIREELSKKNPSWDAKEVELEIRAEYGKQLQPIDLNTIDREEDPEGYREAERHNEKVEENSLRIQRAARDGRKFLIEEQSKIELPKLHKDEPTPTAPSAEELAEKQKNWVKSVEDNIGQLKNIKETIDDREVEYGYNDDELKEFGDKMKAFNIVNYAKERGWINDKGETDFVKLGRDVQWIEDRSKITKSFATQFKTEATKDALKRIKNVTEPTRDAPAPTGEPESLGDAYTQARQAAGW